MCQDHPATAREIYLHPGEYYVGEGATRIRTVLGSCVSLVFWHPRRNIGGMCHYMLPCRTHRASDPPDGRYADEAADLVLRELKKMGTRPSEYQVKVFGGANLIPHAIEGERVGERNVAAARQIVHTHGLTCVSEHLLGKGHRQLMFDIASGHVWVKYQPSLTGEHQASPRSSR